MTTLTVAEQIELAERIIAEQRAQIEKLKAMTPEEVASADAAANAENERQIAEEAAVEQREQAKKQAKVAQKEQWAKDIEVHIHGEGECSADCQVCEHENAEYNYDGPQTTECDIRYCEFCAFRHFYLCEMCRHSKADSTDNPGLCVPCADVVASTRDTKKLEESQ